VFYTWVNIRCKYLPWVGQDSVQINTLLLRRLSPPGDTVGPARHAIGIVMFCLPLVSAMFEPYVDAIWPGLRPKMWEAQLVGDLMLVASFFVLGGDFWNKFRALFTRTAGTLDDGGSGSRA